MARRNGVSIMNPNNQWYRNGLVYLLIIVTLAALAFNIFQQPRQTRQIQISELVTSIKNNEASKTSVNGSTITVTYKSDGRQATASLGRNPNVSFEDTMRAYGVTPEQLLAASVVYETPPQWDNIIALLG